MDVQDHRNEAIGDIEETANGISRAEGNVNIPMENIGSISNDLNLPQEASAQGFEIESNEDWPMNLDMKEIISPGTAVVGNGKEPKTSDVRPTSKKDLLKENMPEPDEVTTSGLNAERGPDSIPLLHDVDDDKNMEQFSSKLDGTESQRPGSTDIRKRRLEAMEGMQDLASADGTSTENDSNIQNVAQQIETDTVKKLLEEIVEEAQSRKRRSIQETNQQELNQLRTSVTEEVEEQRNSAPDPSVSPETSNDDAQNTSNQDKCQTARQSCMEMDYSKADIDQAVNVYQRTHGGSDDYSGADLASIIETWCRKQSLQRQEEAVQDSVALHSSNHDPPYDVEPVTMATDSGQYMSQATVTYNGCPNDNSRPHSIQVDVSLKKCPCGRETKISCNFRFP